MDQRAQNGPKSPKYTKKSKIYQKAHQEPKKKLHKDQKARKHTKKL